jgi:transposase-like protein
MEQQAASGHPACRHCGSPETHGHGSTRGKRRWQCRTCGRSFGVTTGTPLAKLKTDNSPAANPEIARTLVVVLPRGSLRAAEAVTGHKYETISGWVRRAGAHAEALTEVLVRDLHLSAVEVDEFWSFVRTKGGAARTRRRSRANAGAALPQTERAVS